MKWDASNLGSQIPEQRVGRDELISERRKARTGLGPNGKWWPNAVKSNCMAGRDWAGFSLRASTVGQVVASEELVCSHCSGPAWYDDIGPGCAGPRCAVMAF